jgi:hypothetical protein
MLAGLAAIFSIPVRGFADCVAWLLTRETFGGLWILSVSVAGSLSDVSA